MKPAKMVLLILIFAIAVCPPVFAADKQVIGWVEMVGLYPGRLKIKAKIDTGADNSSLNVTKIKYVKHNGENWVAFEIRNFEGRSENYTARVVRTAEIKRHGLPDQRRPVVKLGICLGGTFKEVEVNLTDRSGFSYQMLVGRSFLEGSFIIDPEIEFVSQPECPHAATP